MPMFIISAQQAQGTNPIDLSYHITNVDTNGGRESIGNRNISRKSYEDGTHKIFAIHFTSSPTY
jgi:hypothetical protein